ncbi:MAG TPA: sodium:solute symporter [Thermoanaerobaculia bacterium]|nr:sodium:solute symporter [Thermoanaerobaculia bacterium]
MAALDLFIIAAYLAVILAIGFWCRKRQKTTRHYFLAGRHLPWWAISGSIVATETSAITFVSIPGVAFARGGDFTFLQLVLGYLLGRIVICILFIPAYFRRSLLTIYELLRSKFGPQVKSLAASLFIVMRTIADGVRLLLTSVVMATVWRAFFPGIAAPTATAISIAIIGGVMLLFTAAGGMEAVVWTEVLHVGVYIIGAIAAATLLIHAIPGGFHGAIAIGDQAHKFRVFDFAFDLKRPYTFWAGVIGGCFLNMSTHGTDQYMVQRYLCTTSSRKASMALLASGAVILVQFIGFLFIGVLLFAFYRPDRLAGYASGVPAIPFTTPDQVFPDFIINHVPSGLSGLIIAAVLAAATSPSVNSIAATAVTDLYQPLVRDRSDHHYLRVSRLLTVVAGIAQITVALTLIGTTASAVNTALGVASLINGPILGVFLLSAMQREGSTAAFAGMIAGIVAVTSVWLLNLVAWPWFAVIGSLTTLGVGLALARSPSPREAGRRWPEGPDEGPTISS